mmetsp:Transcript_31178/g.72527  ORF Transcript_31178/g.72527 Transcript_31178/m.72527 type:complete len:239 (-) Transcript_31178:186-902(-)
MRTSAPLMDRFDAIVFDKDGTLLDFSATWDKAIYEAIERSAPNDVPKQSAIASLLGYDLERRTVLLDAPVVHASNTELAAMLNGLVDGERMVSICTTAVLQHVTPADMAVEVLHRLRDSKIPFGVATNDDEAAALAQFKALGWIATEQPLLNKQHIFGCDSGYGHKPEPGMLVAAAKALGAPAERCAMIGDARGDLEAARKAGFAAAILVGPAAAVQQHAHLADYWIKDLGGLLQPTK